MSDNKQISLGLSLGSHPLVGIAVLPLLKMLRDQDAICIKKVMGTGQGALSAAMVCDHKSEKEIRETLTAFYKESFYNRFNKNMALSMFNIGPQSYHPSQSFFSGDGKHEFFDRIFGDTKIESLDIPLYLVATDLFTAEPVIISSGLLSKAVYGASAWFPFHPPIRHQGRLLVSGGFSESIPTLNDASLDLEIAILINDKKSWQESKSASDGWAFFERAFQTLEAPCKKMVRKSKGTNIIPLTIDFKKAISFENVTEEDLNYVYHESEKVMQQVICSK